MQAGSNRILILTERRPAHNIQFLHVERGLILINMAVELATHQLLQ